MFFAVFPFLALFVAGATVADAGSDMRSLVEIERAVQSDPENLQLAAEYRQLAIPARDFDRPIGVLEKLAKQKGSGPNVQISLALAYVDKVPVTSRIRHLYLGRDAMSALTRAIDRRPTALAYYVRGLINLFYNNFMFHRAPLGIDDLQKALTLVTPDTPQTLVERILVALGDGYWRVENQAKAREVWSSAAARFPESAALKERLSGTVDQTAFAVRHALDEDRRVDTSLRDMLPER